MKESTWDQERSRERQSEDDAAQAKLLGYLERTRGAEQHAKLVKAEIPCTRFRAEEVAATSGISGHPIPFSRAEPEGRRVLEALRAPQPSAAEPAAPAPSP